MQDKSVRAVLDMAQVVQYNCAPFCEAYELSYIQLRRTFDDGSFIFITNTPLFFIDFIERYHDKLPASFQREKDIKETVYLSSNYVPPLLASLAKDKHNIQGALSLTSKHEGYCDLFTVGLPKPHKATGTFFMNILPDIQAFQAIFLKKHEVHLEALIKKGIFHTGRTLVKETSLEEFKKFEGRNGVIELADEEAFLMHYLLLGKTVQDIGDLINVSFPAAHSRIQNFLEKIGQPLFTVSSVSI